MYIVHTCIYTTNVHAYYIYLKSNTGLHTYIAERSTCAQGTYIQEYIIWRRTYKKTYAKIPVHHINLHACKQTNMHACMHTGVHTYLHTYMHRNIHTVIHAQLCKHVFKHTYIKDYIYTGDHIHENTHTYTYI